MGESLIIRKGGGGGGGLEINGQEIEIPANIWEADGPLQPGDFVQILNANGTFINQNASSLDVTQAGFARVFANNITNDTYMFTFINLSTNQCRAAIGTQSGTTIAFSSFLNIATTASSSSFLFTAKITGTNRFIVIYIHSAGDVRLRIIDGAGVTPTLVGTEFNTGFSMFSGMTLDSSNNGVIFFKDSNNHLIGRTINLTSTTITLGGNNTITTADVQSPIKVAWTGNVGKFLILYKYQNQTTDPYHFRALTISGTTITTLSENMFMDTNLTSRESRAAFELHYSRTQNKIVFLYRANRIGFTVIPGSAGGALYARMITFNNSNNTYTFEKRNLLYFFDVNTLSIVDGPTDVLAVFMFMGNAIGERENTGAWAYISINTTTNDIIIGRTHRMNQNSSPLTPCYGNKLTFAYFLSGFTSSTIAYLAAFSTATTVPTVFNGIRAQKTTHRPMGVVKVGTSVNGGLVTVIVPPDFI
jgi:hypothetical protein